MTAPAAAVSGAQADITVAWSGLTTGTRYLAFVHHGDGADRDRADHREHSNRLANST